MIIVRFSTIRAAAGIILVAAILGFLTNLFHPDKIHIATSPLPIDFAPDSLEAEILPDIGIHQQKIENSLEQPIFINKSQLLSLIKNEQYLLIDTRSKNEYKKEHIPTALNLPYHSIVDNKERLKNLPKDKWIVTYCDDERCDLSELMAYELFYSGYQLVAIYSDGLKGWRSETNLNQIQE